MSLVNKPTRGSSYLDRIYANELCYKYVRVVSSAVKSHHCAVIAYSDDIPRSNINKQHYKRRFRQHTPAQHDQYLQYASKDNIDFSTTDDVQANFDQMYRYLHEMLNRFYPERETTVTTADQHFVTTAVKAMLRRKNRLMRAGRVEEAAAIAKRVRSIITKNNSVRLHRCDTRRNVRKTWSKVRAITRRRNDDAAAGIILTADVLNRHYTSISTDPAYVPVQRKLTAGGAGSHFTEYDVFHMLDRLKPTATGMMVYRRGFCECQPLSSRPRLLLCLISQSYRVSCPDSGRPLLSPLYLKILRP